MSCIKDETIQDGCEECFFCLFVFEEQLNKLHIATFGIILYHIDFEMLFTVNEFRNRREKFFYLRLEGISF